VTKQKYEIIFIKEVKTNILTCFLYENFVLRLKITQKYNETSDFKGIYRRGRFLSA